MVFLGMLLDGKCHIIMVPTDKVSKATNYLRFAIENRKVTVKFIQQLTRILNFLNRAIVPGRAFTCGMYGKLRMRNSKGELLKQHHHIYLNSSFIQDCHVWFFFLKNASVLHLCRPFTDFKTQQTYKVLNLYSDASRSEKLGLGPYLKTNGFLDSGTQFSFGDVNQALSSWNCSH